MLWVGGIRGYVVFAQHSGRATGCGSRGAFLGYAFRAAYEEVELVEGIF